MITNKSIIKNTHVYPIYKYYIYQNYSCINYTQNFVINFYKIINSVQSFIQFNKKSKYRIKIYFTSPAQVTYLS